jgi:hypothetical protein
MDLNTMEPAPYFMPFPEVKSGPGLVQTKDSIFRDILEMHHFFNGFIVLSQGSYQVMIAATGGRRVADII